MFWRVFFFLFMYPLISLGNYFDIYTFGLCLIIAWALFFGLLHRFSTEQGMTKHVFTDVILFTLAIFFFARIAYIFTEWRNEKYIFVDLVEGTGILNFLREFFITEDYHLSLAGGIFGFFVILFWKIRRSPKVIEKYLNVIVMAFLMSAPIGYFGALLGGQIYGIPFDSLFSLSYTNKESIVPGGMPRFPLPILYIIATVGIVFFLRKITKEQSYPPGFVGYVGMGLYGGILFLLEFLNSSGDMFSSFPPYLSLLQLTGCLFMLVSIL
jgi:prolipoprotein diacylglyceryltransferase